MSVFSAPSINHSEQIAQLGHGFAAAAIQYIATAQRDPSTKLTSWSNVAAGLGTGAAMFFVSLSLLQLLGS